MLAVFAVFLKLELLRAGAFLLADGAIAVVIALVVLFVGKLLLDRTVFARCADRLSPAHPWHHLRLSGGLSRDLPLLKDLLQARFPSATLVESTQEEETLAGLARIAAGAG